MNLSEHTNEISESQRTSTQKCYFKNCPKRPHFLVPGKNTLLCKEHRTEDSIIINKKCFVNGCNKLPSYINDENKKFCSEHSSKNMTNLKKKCAFIGCPKIPIFGAPENKSLKLCKDHKSDKMVNISSKICEDDFCNKRPSYGLPESKIAQFCKEHIKEGMVDVTHPKCDSTGCSKLPTFGIPGTKIANFCKEHKSELMVDIKSKKCIYQGCNKQASYGNINTKVVEFCAEHKPENMSDLKSKKCNQEGCIKMPNYGYKDNKKIMWCKEHKKEDMIDIKHIMCHCGTRASYGKLFQPKIHCAKHKTNNEFLKNHPKCEIKNCKIKPFYSDNNYSKRCEHHQKKGDSNIVEIKCNSCGLLNFINNSLGLCNDCFEYKEKRIHKVKEKEVIDFISHNGFEFVSTDKSVDLGCSKRRPDGIIDFKYFSVCLEVDENQHKSYACECEQGRMIQIHQDFGGTPVLFIRYNPDDYIDHFGRKNKPDTKRLRTLLNVLNGLKNRINLYEKWDDPLSVIYLFYDGFNGNIERNLIKYI